LYKKAKILIFDEATSALDTDTENAVMTAIDNLNRELTILMVAHRLSTLQNCDLIVQLVNGKIVSQGPFVKVGTAQQPLIGQ
jgi:ATP-binding cassette subfamily B protein